MTISLYGLLHLCENESSAENVSVKNFRDQAVLYLKCAVTLSRSLEDKGIPFTLLTNRKKTLDDLLQEENDVLDVAEIPFVTRVPHGAKFYSAHYKIDVFRYFAKLSDDYVGFCDLDMICINDFPRCFYNNIKRKIPMCYDISDQAFLAYGHDRIIQNLQLVNGLESEGRRYGGEFVTGTPSFFASLTKQIDRIYDNYVANMSKLCYVGDEAVTSAALELMKAEGMNISDAGTMGLIGRFWSFKTAHPDRPLCYYERCCLLHLPSDKRFLAGLQRDKTTSLAAFKKCYHAYRRRSYWEQKFKRTILRTLKILRLR